MIDLHTHILPCMDDGSRSTAESEQMLCQLERQGVDVVAATPHFYAHKESPQEFLCRRQRSFEQLRPSDRCILLGAEVAYFSGISHCAELPKLCIEGTGLLLLEMPFTDWNSRVIDEVCVIRRRYGLTVVLAHIDRYHRMPNFTAQVEELLQRGIKLQCNTQALLPLVGGGKMIRMIRDGAIHFLGTDCHGMSQRAPNMAEAIAKVRKKLGQAQFRAFCDRAKEIMTR